MPISDKEKGKEILKRRRLAQKGIDPDAKPEGEDPIEEEEERENKIASNGLAIGLGLKRSG